jgi:hypothetical protein
MTNSKNSAAKEKKAGLPNASVAKPKRPDRDLKALQRELDQRDAELAVINSIQQGLAAELDFQSIIDLVGNKIREILIQGILASGGTNRRKTLSTIFMSLNTDSASKSHLRRRGAAPGSRW